MSSRAGPSKRRTESPIYIQDEFGPSAETQFVPQPGDSQAMFEALEILDEKGSQYLIRWAGQDPMTGLPYKPSWEPKNGATPLLVQEWKKAKKEDPSIVGQSERKRKRKAGTRTASPKRSRRDESTATETSRQRTPATTSKSTHSKGVKQEDHDSSYQPSQDGVSRGSEILTEEERSMSPVKQIKRRPRTSVLEVELPLRRQSTPSRNGPLGGSLYELSPDKGKRKAPIVIDDSTEESAGNASIVPDSQSQSQSLSLPEGTRQPLPPSEPAPSMPVPSVDPDVFRPFLEHKSSLADQTVMPSSVDLPSQAESIQQFTSPVSKRGDRDGSNIEEENQPVQESADEQDDSSSSSAVPLKMFIAEDGTEMWVAADESVDGQREEDDTFEDGMNELDDQATIESVLLPETNGPGQLAEESAEDGAVGSEIVMEVTTTSVETVAPASPIMNGNAVVDPAGSSTVREAQAELSLAEAENTIERLTQERDRAIRAERVRAEEHNFALNLYNQASNKAVEAAESNKVLRAQVSTLQEQLDFGLKQRDLFNEAVAAAKNKELLQLRAQLRILQAQNRLTDDDVRERARRCDEAEQRNALLHEQLVNQTERNDRLRDRNTELARRNDYFLAEKTGVTLDDDDEESDYESEAEYSDTAVAKNKPPSQPAPAISASHIDMQDDDLDAAVAMASQPAEPVTEGVQPISSSQSRHGSAGPQSLPNFANASADQWWACKWHDGVEGCPVLSKSRQELEEHVGAHVRGTIDSQGANMVALS